MVNQVYIGMIYGMEVSEPYNLQEHVLMPQTRTDSIYKAVNKSLAQKYASPLSRQIYEEILQLQSQDASSEFTRDKYERRYIWGKC